MDKFNMEDIVPLPGVSMHVQVNDSGKEAWWVTSESGWISQHLNYNDAFFVAKEVEKHERLKASTAEALKWV